MNVRNLQKKSETDWAQIDRMTDDEIDTSDIPPLDEAFFKSAKWLLPRWCFDLRDFRQAKEFAEHILKRKWQQNLNESPVKRVEHSAFNTALIVSYARPFHNNMTLKGAPASSLRKQVGEVLSEATEVELHERILRLRDTVIAHSDGRAIGVYGGFTGVVENLCESEVKLLKRMIKKWIGYLGIEHSKLKKRIAEALQDDGEGIMAIQSNVRRDKAKTLPHRMRKANR